MEDKTILITGSMDGIGKQTNFSGGSPVTAGSQKLVYLATAPELATVTGKYFSDNRQTRSAEITYDPETRKKLWDLSVKLCGLTKGQT